MRTLINSTFAVTAGLIGALAATSAAFAQPREAIDLPDREPTRVVVAAADLTGAAGVQATYARLSRAAVAACDSGPDSNLAARMEDRACAAQALDRAVSAIGDLRLSALNGGPGAVRIASR